MSQTAISIKQQKYDADAARDDMKLEVAHTVRKGQE